MEKLLRNMVFKGIVSIISIVTYFEKRVINDLQMYPLNFLCTSSTEIYVFKLMETSLYSAVNISLRYTLC